MEAISLNKFKKQEWDILERSDPHLKQIGLMLRAQALKYVQVTNNSFTRLTMDSDIYIKHMRPQLPYATSIELRIDDIKKKQKKQSKRDELRTKNIIRWVLDDLNKLMSTNTKPPSCNVSYKYTESIIIHFIVWAHHSMKQKDMESIFDAMLSLSRILYLDASGCVKNDVQGTVTLIRKYLHFADIIEACILYPSLITKCSWSIFEPLVPYDEQLNIMNSVSESVVKNTPLLARYVTAPSSGKTSVTVGICSIAERHNKTVVYVCYNETVRMEVGRMLHLVSIPFANFSDGMLTPSFSCYNSKDSRKRWKVYTEMPLMERVDQYLKESKKLDKPPVCLICDLVSAFHTLKNINATCITIVDEPTAGSDVAESALSTLYVSILLHASPITLMFSATLPEYDEIPWLIKSFKGRYANANMITIKSSKMMVACTLYDNCGDLVAPHNYVDSVDDLKRMIDRIESDYFLKRYYTPKVLKSLMILFAKHNVIPPEENDIVTCVSHEFIAARCVQLLRIGVYAGIGLDIINIREQSCRHPLARSSITLDNFCTTDAHNLPGLTIIVSNKPTDFMISVINMIGDHHNLDKYIKCYESDMVLYHKNMENIQRDENLVGEIEKLNASEHVQHPKLQWPSRNVINSQQHIRTYSGITDERMLSKLFHKSMQMPDVDVDMLRGIPDGYDSALISGVGFSHHEGSVHKKQTPYESIVLCAADCNSISFLSTSSAIAYGTNLPSVRIFIDDVSITKNMIHQLIGRAGRTRKSDEAECILSKNIVKIAFADDCNVEAENMAITANKLGVCP